MRFSMHQFRYKPINVNTAMLNFKQGSLVFHCARKFSRLLIKRDLERLQAHEYSATRNLPPSRCCNVQTRLASADCSTPASSQRTTRHNRLKHKSSWCVPEPSTKQLRAQFIKSAVPMVGFGFMDQTIMLQAGNVIDCTLGVTLGLSTLSAAAFGQIFSNAGSILFGGGVEQVAANMGLKSPNFTLEQTKLPIVRKRQMEGSLFGVILGCTLGLVNLLFINVGKTRELKLHAALEDHKLPYKVELSNSRRPYATTIRIRGGDRDGLVASVATALSQQGLSLIEVVAKTKKRNSAELFQMPIVEDVFVVQDGTNKGQVDESELPRLAEIVLDAANAE
jgi:hypothetical protein